jgi:hypothetical protein
MRGFQRLLKLELPLEIAMCNITAAAACPTATTHSEPLVVGDGSMVHYEMNEDKPFINHLVPASVSQVSL